MLLTFILASATSVITPQQQDEFCYSLADLGVATIEAREAGVPVDQVLASIRSQDDGSEVARIFIPIMRKGVLKAYSEPPLGIDKMSKQDRQKLINRFTAECLLELDGAQE